MGSYDTGLDEDPTRKLVTVLELAPDDEKENGTPTNMGMDGSVHMHIYIYISS